MKNNTLIIASKYREPYLDTELSKGFKLPEGFNISIHNIKCEYVKLPIKFLKEMKWNNLKLTIPNRFKIWTYDKDGNAVMHIKVDTLKKHWHDCTGHKANEIKSIINKRKGKENKPNYSRTPPISDEKRTVLRKKYFEEDKAKIEAFVAAKKAKTKPTNQEVPW